MFAVIKGFVLCFLVLVLSPPIYAQSLEKRFEDVLNTMLVDVHRDLRLYKKERKVLDSLLKPSNLRDPNFIEENYLLFQATTLSMRERMERVIKSFDEAHLGIQALLKNEPANIREDLLGKWGAVQKKNTMPYVAYFVSEGDIIQAQESLMRLFYRERHTLEIDVRDGSVFFPTEVLQKKCQALLNRISDLKAQQKAALRLD